MKKAEEICPAGRTIIGKDAELMSNLNNNWMSCRTSSRSINSTGVALLPQFNVPAVTDFSIENNRPPHLPDRNSPSRACIFTLAFVLCIVGSFHTLNVATEPVLAHTSRFARGVSSAVGRAINHANEEAKLNALKHYEAREVYLKRRLGHAEERDLEDRQPVASESQPIITRRRQSALLLRMAALQKADSSISTIDYDALEQFFPRWRKPSERWNQDEVLSDLILAVSQLANSVSVQNSELE